MRALLVVSIRYGLPNLWWGNGALKIHGIYETTMVRVIMLVIEFMT